MSELIVATFTDDATAGAALDAIRRLKSGGLASIEDAAVIRKDADGKTRVKNSMDSATVGGAAVGGFLGAVLIVFFPLIGLVGGAVAGGLIGHSLGRHVEKSFVDDVSKQLEAGQSALFVLLRVERRRRGRRTPADRRRDARADHPGSRTRTGPGRGVEVARRPSRPDADRDRPPDRGACRCRPMPAYPVIREMAVAAEAGGLDSLWVYDHLLFRYDGEEATGLHECWTILAAIADATRAGRARHARHVHGRSATRPLLAKMAATLDHVSGGRLILGHRVRLARPGIRGVRLPDRPQGRPVRGVAARSSARPDPRPAGRTWIGTYVRPGTPSSSRPRGPTSRSSSRPSVRGCWT